MPELLIYYHLLVFNKRAFFLFLLLQHHNQAFHPVLQDVTLLATDYKTEMELSI